MPQLQKDFMHGLFLGLPPRFGNLPQIHFILPLLWRFRAVRVEPREKILHETVFFICLDSCGSPHCRDTVLSHHQEHLRGTHLVYSPCINDNL